MNITWAGVDDKNIVFCLPRLQASSLRRPCLFASYIPSVEIKKVNWD